VEVRLCSDCKQPLCPNCSLHTVRVPDELHGLAALVFACDCGWSGAWGIESVEQLLSDLEAPVWH
jgi:hypothetical protein